MRPKRRRVVLTVRLPPPGLARHRGGRRRGRRPDCLSPLTSRSHGRDRRVARRRRRGVRTPARSGAGTPARADGAEYRSPRTSRGRPRRGSTPTSRSRRPRRSSSRWSRRTGASRPSQRPAGRERGSAPGSPSGATGSGSRGRAAPAWPSRASGGRTSHPLSRAPQGAESTPARPPPQRRGRQEVPYPIRGTGRLRSSHGTVAPATRGSGAGAAVGGAGPLRRGTSESPGRHLREI
jgi:hypothetical protein